MTAEKSAFLPISAAEAFALLTEPDRLRRWMTVSARVDLRAGGAYRWTVVPGHIASGTFREIEPGRRLVFGWGWEGDPDPAPDGSTVTITFEPADGGTVVRLVHDGLTDEQAANHLQGWVQFLGRLERVAAGDEPGLTEMTASPPDLDPLLSAEACLAVCQLVLRGVSGSDLARPTPCTEFTVAQVVDHLVESLQRLGGMVGAEVAPSGSTDVEPRVADAGQQALEAWRRHGLDGSVPFGDRQLPRRSAPASCRWSFSSTPGTSPSRPTRRSRSRTRWRPTSTASRSR